MLKPLPALLLLAAAALLPGCQAAFINPGPDAAVAFAINRVSPAMVQLIVVEDNYVDGVNRPLTATGSGTIIDKEGHILTNFHVAGRAKRIDVTLPNKERVRAALVGSDHWTDLALVKLDMDEIARRHLTFSTAELGDSSKVVLGQPVMAMGAPYGLARTLTKGIISNTERAFAVGSIEGYETGWFNNWLQMDAAINPGNSGGPLINLRGEIIGINTRGYEGANNLGFAIPSNVAKAVIPEILKDKKVARSYTGLQLQVLQDLEKHYDLPPDRGVLIGNVERYSPASTAGLGTEDVLLAINDKPVVGRFPEQLALVRKQIADYPIGTELKLTVLQRSSMGKEKQVDVTVKTEKLESAITEQKTVEAWGITVRNLTRAYLRNANLKQLLEKPGVEGVLVTGIQSASLADTAKLAENDVITRINQRPIKSVDDLDAAVKAWAAGKEAVAIDITRGRIDTTIVLKAKPATP